MGLMPVSRTRPLLVALALAAATCVFYAGVLDNAFVNYDDDLYITDPREIEAGLSRESLVWAFTSIEGANWFPVTRLSWLLDVQLFGVEARGFHASSLLLHVVNSLLLLLALTRLTGALAPSAFVAGVFALHPLHVESVAWVAERKDVLSGLFFLLTLAAWLGYARRPGAARYLLVALLFALGLMAKPMLVTLPCVLLLLDVWPLGRTPLARAATEAAAGARASWARLAGEKLPLLALSAAASAVAVFAQAGDRAMGDLGTLPLGWRVANALTSYAAYLGKALWPADLAIFSPHAALVAPASYSALAAPVFAAALLLAAVTAGALWTLRSRPYLAVGWLWYLGMLVPVIGLVQVGEQRMADRYTYLPFLGLYLAAAFGARDLARARPALRPALAAAVPLLLFALLGQAWRQVAHWRSSETVFRHALAVTPDNYFAHNHLGRAYENAGQLEPAAEQYRAAIRIRPSAGALSNLGNVLAKLGDTEQAVASFEAALSIDPDSPNAHGNLGVVYGMIGDGDRAVASYERALALDPEHGATHYNLGSLLLRRGEIERGAGHLERAVALNPFHVQAANNLGVARAELGRTDEALAAYEHALALDPQHPGTLCNLGRAHERAGHASRAVARYEQAAATDPRCAHAFRYLGRRHFHVGEALEARPHFESLLRLAPQNADAHNDVASVYAQLGDHPRARAHFEHALRLDPDNATAVKNLARLDRELAEAGVLPAVSTGPAGPAGAAPAPAPAPDGDPVE